MPQLHFIYPGDLAAPTGGYAYDRRIIDELRALGWQVAAHAVDASFPEPTDVALADAANLLRAIPDARTVVIDGLALGGMPALLGEEAARLRLVALVHHPLAFETGLDTARARRLRDAERQALRHARRVVVTSCATARSLAAYDIPSERIAVVEPGTDPAPLVRASGSRDLALLCVAALTPRKGHAVLVDALAQLCDRPWQLDCVGSMQRSPETAAALARRIDALRLGDRVRLVGEVSERALHAFYDRADVFVLASHVEGYGMALAEAIARGLPVVSTRVGAAEEIAPPTAGVLVPPGDASALAAGLGRLMDDEGYRASLAAGASAARAALPAWSTAASRFAAAVQSVT